MPNRYRLWTHGAAVIVEHTKEFTDDDNGLYMRRAGWGALIKQKKGTSNWFHFAIPTPIEIANNPVLILQAWLRIRASNDALIDQVHVREAPGPNSSCPIIYDSGPLTYGGNNSSWNFDIYGDHVCKGPLLLCIHVVFNNDDSEVVFAGAGGVFKEVT